MHYGCMIQCNNNQLGAWALICQWIGRFLFQISFWFPVWPGLLRAYRYLPTETVQPQHQWCHAQAHILWKQQCAVRGQQFVMCILCCFEYWLWDQKHDIRVTSRVIPLHKIQSLAYCEYAAISWSKSFRCNEATTIQKLTECPRSSTK